MCSQNRGLNSCLKGKWKQNEKNKIQILEMIW